MSDFTRQSDRDNVQIRHFQQMDWTAMMKKTLASIGASTLVGAAIVVGLPASAMAAEAPSCVKRSVGTTGGTPSSAQVKLTNTCSTSKRLEVIWTHAHDTGCFTLGAGKSTTKSSSIARPFSSYDKTVTC